jgi:hypothetical protein
MDRLTAANLWPNGDAVQARFSPLPRLPAPPPYAVRCSPGADLRAVQPRQRSAQDAHISAEERDHAEGLVQQMADR